MPAEGGGELSDQEPRLGYFLLFLVLVLVFSATMLWLWNDRVMGFAPPLALLAVTAIRWWRGRRAKVS